MVARPVVQPVTDVLACLATRTPRPHFEQEPELFITLPQVVRVEVAALLRACLHIQRGLRNRLFKSVHAGVVQMVALHAHRGWTVKRFRAIYDAWSKSGDWVALVNRSKAGAAWQSRDATALPEVFVTFCAERFARFKRADAKRQAWLAIVREWRTGRNLNGEPVEVPGYGRWQDWFHMEHPGAVLPVEAPLPRGWSYDTVMRQVKRAAKFTKAIQKLSHEGEVAARAFMPQIHLTRAALRFMEEVQFDDVKVDVRVFDPATNEVLDLWLLVARDVATTMTLGFGMRPARVREDGKQDHLKYRDMMQTFGWLLERFGLPPYVMTWKIENASASVSDAQALAIQEVLGQRVRISFASVIKGRSPAGYAERGTGNSKGKAVIESTFRLDHTIRAGLPGATGNRYDVRPADLLAREKECRAICEASRHLPPHLRAQVEYPLLTLERARQAIWTCFNIANERTVHDLEGFEKLVEWYDPARGLWLPGATAPNPLPGDAQVRKRNETPIERAARLRAGHEWSPVSPITITALYEHNLRNVKVEDSGEIVIRHEGVDVRFRSPEAAVAPGTRLLGYYHPDDPAYLHLTDGRGCFVGTWLRVTNVNYGDAEALAQAMRYTVTARAAVKAAAAELAAPERAELEAMRARNAELLELGTFVEVDPAGPANEALVGSPVAAGLHAIGKARTEMARDEKRRAKALEQFEGDVSDLVDHPAREDFGETDDFGAEGLL